MKKYKFLNEGNVDFSKLQGAYPYLHTHEYWEFCMITEGDVWHVINNEKILVKQGTLLLIRPTDIHKFEKYLNNKTVQINITIKKEFFETITTTFSPKLMARFSESYVMLELDNSALAYYANYAIKLQLLNKNSEEFQSECLFFFLSLWEKTARKVMSYNQESKNSYSGVVLSLINKMEDIKYVSLRIEELLSDTHYSHCHIIRKFRSETGKTPSRYFNDIKLRYAKNLLETTNLTVLEISMKVGFSSVGHFSKWFKKTYDTTPLHYRKKWNVYYNSLG